MAAKRVRRVNPGRSTLPAVGDVNAAIRARQALLMRIEGRSYPDIAEACGYADKSGAYRACQRELARYRAPEIAEALALELLRLDTYLLVYHAKAVSGDGWSLDRCLRISEARRKLLGLDYGPRPHDSAQQAQQEYIVIGLPQEVVDAI